MVEPSGAGNRLTLWAAAVVRALRQRDRDLRRSARFPFDALGLSALAWALVSLAVAVLMTVR